MSNIVAVAQNSFNNGFYILSPKGEIMAEVPPCQYQDSLKYTLVAEGEKFVLYARELGESQPQKRGVFGPHYMLEWGNNPKRIPLGKLGVVEVGR